MNTANNNEHHSLPKQSVTSSTGSTSTNNADGSHSFPITFPLQSIVPMTTLGIAYSQQLLIPSTPQQILLVSPQALTPHLTPSNITPPGLIGYTITPSPLGFPTTNATPLFGTYPSFDSLNLNTPAGPIPAPVFESPVPTGSLPSGLGLLASDDPYAQFSLLDIGAFALAQEDPAAAVTGQQSVSEFAVFNSFMDTTTTATTIEPVEPKPEVQVQAAPAAKGQPPTTQLTALEQPPTTQLTTFEQLPSSFISDVLASDPSSSSSLPNPTHMVCMTMAQLRSLITAASHQAHYRTVATPNGPKRRRPAKVFTCPHLNCTRSFTRRFNFETHLETHNPNRKKHHACEVGTCGKVFFRPYDLKRHVAKSHGEHMVAGSCRDEGAGLVRSVSPVAASGRRWSGKVKLEDLRDDEDEENGSDWTGDE